MAATDHLSTELFHGTAHPFEPGDVVNPTDTEHTEAPMAWATTDLGHATKIAGVKVRMHNRRTPDDPASPYVFEVEHMSGPADVWGSRHVADPKGFRVKRKVES